MAYGFVAYIDESGDDGIDRVRPNTPDGSSEWFILAAVVVQAKNEKAVGRWHRGILEKFDRLQRRDIHYYRLSDYRKTVVCHEISIAPLRCFVVMSNKKNIEGWHEPRFFPEKNFLYWWMSRLLLERVTRFCSNKSQRIYGEPLPVKLVFSLRGGMLYDRLIKYLDLLRFQSRTGRLHLNVGDLSWNVVDLDQIHVMAHRNEIGLQFADVVAGAFYESVSLDSATPCRAEYAKILIPRLYRGPGGQVIDFGVKPMPSLAQMKLRPEQRQIFEALGYSKKW